MDKSVRFSIKDFKEKLAIFEGNNQNSKKDKEQNDKISNLKSCKDTKKLDLNNDVNKLSNQNKGNKGQMIDIKNNIDYNKNMISNKHMDKFILERLKILYPLEKGGQTYIQRKNSVPGSSEIKSKIEKIETNINSKGQEMNYINRYIKDIRKKDNFYKHPPKKLNLKKIFKEMNIEQCASNVNEDKRKEIMKVFMATKDEKKNKEKIIDNSSKSQEVDKKEISENNKKEIEEEKNSETINEELLIKDEDKNFLNFDNDFQMIEPEKIHEKNIDESHKEKEEIINFEKNIFVPQKIEEKNINSEIASKIEMFSPKETNNKEKQKISEIKKEEKQIKTEKSSGKNFISSLNDLYNKKKITINNNDKTIKKIEKSKLDLYNKEPSLSNKRKETEEDFSLYATDDENIFLEGKNISNSQDNENIDKFCECFFLASFPTSEGKIIPNSENIQSDCGHIICSKLPAMEPDIIYKYPKDIKNLEINSLAASICFPNGIKLCYEENESKIKVVNNYRSTLTNQSGRMFFIYTYHFYLRMPNEEFIATYKVHPIRYMQTTYLDEFTQIFNEDNEEDIIKKLEMYQKLGFNEYVYIPFCLGIISKFPYYHQITLCLESIFTRLNNMENEDSKNIHNLITYIIRSIPAPHKNSKVSFSLPYINKITEIHYPYFQDILLFGNDPMLILEHFSINNIICILRLILFEQKILVIGKDIDLISQIILNFISLLYPFEWIHTYIPVMSIKMLKFLQSFLPFFNGMNITLFKEAKNILSKSEDVFIINVDDDNIDISSNLRKKDKTFKANIYINKNFPSLPKGIENLFIKELKLIKIEIEKYKNYNIFDKQVINNRIKNIFLQIFVEILYDCDKYSYIVDDYPCFNSSSMINDKPKADKSFYEEITSAQMFQMFIQKSLLEEELNYYFDDKIKEYKNLKEKGLNLGEIINLQITNLQNEYSEAQKINKNYIIKPFLIEKYNDYEKQMKKSKTQIGFRDINEFIYSQSFEDNSGKNKDSRGKLKKNNRIIDKLFKLNNEDDLSSYKIFLIPGEIIKNNNKNKSDKKDIEKTDTSKRKTSKITIISNENEVNRRITYSFMIKNEENELNEEEKEEITDNIKDIMKKVYKSSIENSREEKELFMDSVKTKFGRDYFVNIIGSSSKKNSTIKIVENKSFDFLEYIIFNVLLNILNLEDNNYNLMSVLKLTKACFYIKTIKNKKEILLCDEIFLALDDYSLYIKKEFWQKWIEDEMTKDEIEIYKKLKNSSDENIKNTENYKLYSKHSYEIIDKLFGVMMKLRLSNYFIYSNYSDLSREYIFEYELLDKLIKEMIIGLQYYQKLLKHNTT